MMKKRKGGDPIAFFHEPSPQEQRAHAAEHLARVVVDTSPKRKADVAKVRDAILSAVMKADKKKA